MKRCLSAVVTFVLMSAPAVAAQRITVPAHTPIKLVCDSVVVSTVAVNPGDQLDFHVADAVVVDGYVIIPADAKAVGHIVSGGGMEVSQHLFGAKVENKNQVYALDYVVSADGGKIKLDGTPTDAPVTKQAKANLFFGKKAAAGVGLLNKGTVVAGSVDHLVHVQATEKAAAGGGYDQ